MTKSSGNVAIGGLFFDTGSRELTDSQGGPVPLRAQSAEVLALLVAKRGVLVEKAEIMDTVWSDTFVTDDSLVKCISDIRKALGPDGELLVTVPKRGYRLAASEAVPPEVEAAPLSATQTPPARRRTLGLALSAVVLAAIVALALIWAEYPRHSTSGDTTLAILPFRNADGDPDQRYLSMGVAEDLNAALSQVSDLRVISQGASFAYTEGARDIRDIARDLRADVVLEGSVRRRGDDLRLTTALVDGNTGQNLWAKQYDGDRGDLLAFQTDVLEELVRTLSVRLSRAERTRLGVRGTTDIEAYEAFLRGRELENFYTRATNFEAAAEHQSAIARDPDFALAYAHLALTLSFRVENSWTSERDETVQAAFEAANRAIELDPELPFAHFVLGRLYSRSFSHHLPGAIDKAFAEFETSIELDPNYVDGYVFLANLHIFNGEAEKALPLVEDALERHPAPPFWYLFAAGMSRYYLDDYEGALPYLIAARDQSPTAPFPYRILIATYGMLGQVDEAEWEAMEYEALGRIPTVEAMLNSGSVSNPEYREKFAKGLRAAGLPES
ncbi:MAG: winged helix-turn-helix domain-containing protein [Silicimonas sp.]|nr:winged helix-turn-helix domain-containing protein [Silicimonas sp.]